MVVGVAVGNTGVGRATVGVGVGVTVKVGTAVGVAVKVGPAVGVTVGVKLGRGGAVDLGVDTAGRGKVAVGVAVGVKVGTAADRPRAAQPAAASRQSSSSVRTLRARCPRREAGQTDMRRYLGGSGDRGNSCAL